MTIHRILFSTDFSEQSFEALGYASQLAASFQAELHFVYVDDLAHLVALAPYCCQNFVPATDRSEMELELRRLKPTIPGVVSVYHYLEGQPADAICTLASTVQIDLIVMSSHGRTGLSHALLGSVAEEVMRRAPCPVFIVKHPSGKSDGQAGEESPSNSGHTAAAS